VAVTRRLFLRSGAIALVGLGTVPRFLARAADSLASSARKLVVVFQRGAADGLNIVVPHAESEYYRLRPSIALKPPGRDGESCLDLDGRFGLHPTLAPLKPLYDDGVLGVVHAAGSPDATRSHFDAQDFMESGTPGVKSTRDGWLNRYLQQDDEGPTFRAVAATGRIPRMLAGKAPALAIPDLGKFGVPGGPMRDVVVSGLDTLYSGAGDRTLADPGEKALAAMRELERLDVAGDRPAHGARYPGDPFGKGMRQMAQLIRADVGLEIGFVEIGGWDHHANEGGAQGLLANRLRAFSDGLAAFARDLGDRLDEVVVVTMSEFGRTAAENGSRGTDHGHANVMFVLGGNVSGGKVLGEWPGLARDRLYEGRDLALTTDFRDVLGEILVEHMKVSDLDAVFPGFPNDPTRRRSLIG
jgi:uncharacterized protein (DUF1501 family)